MASTSSSAASSASLLALLRPLAFIFPIDDDVTEVTKLGSGSYGGLHLHVATFRGNVQMEKSALTEVKVLKGVAGVMMVLELAAGTWRGLEQELASKSLESRVRVAEKHFREAVAGLSFLHQRNIVHRDLKPDNVLVKGREGRLANGVSAIADFGLAADLAGEALAFTSCLTLFATPRWISHIAGLPVDGPEDPKLADVFSLALASTVVIRGSVKFIDDTASFPPPYEFTGRKSKQLAVHRLSFVQKWLNECKVDFNNTAIVTATEWDQKSRPSSESLSLKFPATTSVPVSSSSHSLADRQSKVAASYGYRLDAIKMAGSKKVYDPSNGVDFIVKEINMD